MSQFEELRQFKLNVLDIIAINKGLKIGLILLPEVVDAGVLLDWEVQTVH
jgi:hypothetical protein